MDAPKIIIQPCRIEIKHFSRIWNIKRGVQKDWLNCIGYFLKKRIYVSRRHTRDASNFEKRIYSFKNLQRRIFNRDFRGVFLQNYFNNNKIFSRIDKERIFSLVLFRKRYSQGLLIEQEELQPFSLDDRLSIPPEFPFVSNIRYSMDKRYYIS